MEAESASRPAPTLHLLCGKIATGKSTLARRLAESPKTVLISEDDWLARLYPGEIATLDDYRRCSARLRGALDGHVVALLCAGVSVVMDFPANTVEIRGWLRRLFERAGAAHRLYWLDVADDVCKLRLGQRNAAGGHAFTPSEADFDLFSRHFQPPTPEEGFQIETLYVP
ncbi:AAA family ATPase [Pelagibius marinus]|uniref:AAA family ATPase n=1 Tax=Pelagibius marinus TaxID=2762760 RepID=UPI001872B18E|nr:ATP-binding protein [Pelagibius marinus]